MRPRPPLLCSEGQARLLSWGILSLLVTFARLDAEKGNKGFAEKSKCALQSLAERWVLDKWGCRDACLGWLSQQVKAHMGAAVGPSRVWLPPAPSWLFPITAAMGSQRSLPQEQGL